MTHREELWNKAEKRLYEIYGDHPDLRIITRFMSEKMALAHFGVAEYFDELASIIKESIDVYNEKLIAKNTVSCCFTAYLLGASELNPLPPHYICTTPECKRVEWLGDLDNDKCLFDMRHTRTCECGAEMRIDGYDIPWETYLPYAQRLKTKDPVPENYSDLFEALTKKHFQWSLFGAAQACHRLGQATGVAPDEISINDREVKYRLLGGGDFSCMHPKLAEFSKQVYKVLQPCNYNELEKLIGLSHSTCAWRWNAEELLKSGECKLSDIPATRDEVFMMIRDALQERGVYDTGFAYDVAEKARKGYYAEFGMDSYDTLKNLGFDDWFASYLLGIRYMSTKALSILELRYIIMLTYFKLYYSHEYQEVIAGEDIWQPH